MRFISRICVAKAVNINTKIHRTLIFRFLNLPAAKLIILIFQKILMVERVYYSHMMWDASLNAYEKKKIIKFIGQRATYFSCIYFFFSCPMGFLCLFFYNAKFKSFFLPSQFLKRRSIDTFYSISKASQDDSVDKIKQTKTYH